MPRPKRSRLATKCKTSMSSSTSQESFDGPSVSLLLENFEEEFARKLKKYDELLETKLRDLNTRKEWLKLKYLPSGENVPPDLVTDKETRSAPEIRKQSLRTRTRTLSSSKEDLRSVSEARKQSLRAHTRALSSSKGTPTLEMMSKNVLSENKKLLLPSSSKSMQQTPVGRQINTALMTPQVTPKVTPGTPVSVMRLPRLGELTISMSGSPLLVGNTIQPKRGNINVPLGNGRIISINGEGDLNPYPYAIPSLDEETKRQLQALHENLQYLMNMNIKK